jgi:hypothetical protein
MRQVEAACRSGAEGATARLRADAGGRQWLKATAAGELKRNRDGSPHVRHAKLRQWLAKVSASVRGLYETDVAAPTGPDGHARDDPEDWDGLLDYHPLLAAWSDLFLAPAAAHACVAAGAGVVRPSYELLPRLRSRRPDLDLVRRLGGRDIFAPTPGHVFVAVHLPDLPVRALAAVCRGLPGGSTLAKVFAGGGDPHPYAAAQLDALARQPGPDAARRRRTAGRDFPWEEVARTLLPAVPLGFSLERVCEFVREQPALAGAGLAEVAAWHRALLQDVFPELAGYLRDDTLAVLAGNLGTTAADVLGHLATYFKPVPPLPQLRKWYRRHARVTGRTKDCLKALLDHCCLDPALGAQLARGLSDPDLFVALFGRDVTTPTGRVRGRLRFSQARAAGYLDLADDAAKVALVALADAGFPVVASARGVVLLEEPSAPDVAGRAEQARDVARQGVAEVLGDVPALCEAEVVHRW